MWRRARPPCRSAGSLQDPVHVDRRATKHVVVPRTVRGDGARSRRTPAPRTRQEAGPWSHRPRAPPGGEEQQRPQQKHGSAAAGTIARHWRSRKVAGRGCTVRPRTLAPLANTRGRRPEGGGLRFRAGQATETGRSGGGSSASPAQRACRRTACGSGERAGVAGRGLGWPGSPVIGGQRTSSGIEPRVAARQRAASRTSGSSSQIRMTASLGTASHGR